MIHIGHFAAWKVIAVTWAVALAVYAMEPTVKVALIVAVPSTIASISTLVLGIINRRTLAKVETSTNNMNTELRQQRNAASQRADQAEGIIIGTKAEQERIKEK